MQGIKLEGVSLIKPGADKVIEPEAGPAGQRQGIDHELGNGLVPDRVRLVVEDMDPAIADLHEIDVAGQRGLGGEGNGETQLLLHVDDVVLCEVDRHFDGNRDRIGREHKALERLVPPDVVGHSLQHQARQKYFRIFPLAIYQTLLLRRT